LLRGKPWSIDEERLLRQLVEEGKGTDEISQAMGKTRVSVKAKLYNLGLFLKDATVNVQNRVVSASAAATSPGPIIDPTSTPNIDPASVANPNLVEEVEADLKIRPLPSIEEKMRELDVASKALHHKGLSPTEIKRLGKIIDAARVYNQLFEKYAHYRDLENELVELRRQLASEKSQK
jgi:hypothetical protein